MPTATVSDNEFQPKAMRHYRLGSISFRSGDVDTLRRNIEHWICTTSRNRLIGFINPHVFNLACEHDEVHQFLNEAELVCIDGIGIKLTLLATQKVWAPRVVAEHLFNALLASDCRCDAILIGGEPHVASSARSAMNTASEAIDIVDGIDGYQSVDAYENFLLRHAQIPLVLIGAGSPKSENLARLANTLCTRAVIFHIGGGTLNTWAGNKQRGPLWMSRLGFEWLHRCVYEPHTRHRYFSGGLRYLKNLQHNPSTPPPAHHGETR